MTINNPNIELVIAVLNGIEVDGETMQYIIEKVGMTEQMKSQLGIESMMPEHVLNQIADDIVTDLDNEGLDLIKDQTYGINANEIYLEDITYDKYRIKAVVRDTLRAHFEAVE
jgi:hypothetical protein